MRLFRLEGGEDKEQLHENKFRFTRRLLYYPLRTPAEQRGRRSGAPRIKRSHELNCYGRRSQTPIRQLQCESGQRGVASGCGGAGNFDIDMPLTGTSGVEDRIASEYTAVLTYDVAVTSGEVRVSSGAAVVGAITCSGNEMRVTLSGVTDIQTIVLHTQNINNDGVPHDDVPFGFLAADVNGDRSVSAPDKAFIRANLGVVTAANFRADVNCDGTIELTDGLLVRSHKRNFLP